MPPKRPRQQGGTAPQQESLGQRAAEAVRRLAGQIKQQQGTLTLRQVRRLAEAELGLEEGALESVKTEVRAAVDSVLSGELSAAGEVGAPFSRCLVGQGCVNSRWCCCRRRRPYRRRGAAVRLAMTLHS